jgi:cytochrome c oxidase assembly protein subunit 11
VNAPSDVKTREPKANRNGAVALACAGVFLGMVGLAFASVPLYRIFCQATGYGGTTQVAKAEAAGQKLDRPITVRFDANVADGLDWEFRPVSAPETLKLGEIATAHFHVRNRSDKPLSATAAFNVAPDSMGAYFSKIQCFCFNQQSLKPGEEADLAVTYFVDPAMVDDKNSAGVHTVTLSYTFFPTEEVGRTVVSTETGKGSDTRS